MNTYKTDRHFQSAICNIRCDLEKLAEYAREKWEEDDCILPRIEDEDWGDIADQLQELADLIATNLETNEE